MTQERADALVDALKAEFGGEAEAERVTRDGRYRFEVTSPRFDAVPQLQRQDMAWRVVDRVLSREETLDITLVITYSPRDLQEPVEELS
jgi:hypothetical protein